MHAEWKTFYFCSSENFHLGKKPYTKVTSYYNQSRYMFQNLGENYFVVKR